MTRVVLIAGPVVRSGVPTDESAGREFDMKPHGERRAAVPAPSGRVPLRLTLKPPSAVTDVIDGGWWPRSMDPMAEFPAMIAGVTDRVGPVSRVDYNMDAWGDAPRRIVIDGEMVRLEGIRSLDPRTVLVSGEGWQRATLLVVPPGAGEDAAQSALHSAADPAVRDGAERILLASDDIGCCAPDGAVPVPRGSSSGDARR
ncbi:DUF5994 domain-containing protein [Kibdelosporangium persicum]|uniref:Uncharacterized protein n=1 Tax=Kibdelosporangium persicum TaxID=2698649 RepID=A0ABX2F9Y3_9PSEU|nr:DUF5994 family protein [Kibdelosporangium persicum]NRN68028.1 hypothetical protein [Kibdelosporangium persicum]